MTRTGHASRGRWIQLRSTATVMLGALVFRPQLDALNQSATIFLGTAIVTALAPGITTTLGLTGIGDTNGGQADCGESAAASAVVALAALWMCSESEAAGQLVDSVEIWQRRLLLSIIDVEKWDWLYDQECLIDNPYKVPLPPTVTGSDPLPTDMYCRDRAALRFDAADLAADALCTGATTVGVPVLLAGGWTTWYRGLHTGRGGTTGPVADANTVRSFRRAMPSLASLDAQPGTHADGGGPCWFDSSRYATVAEYAAAHERDRGLAWSAGWDNCGTPLGSAAPWARATWPACVLNGAQANQSRLYMLSGVSSTAIAAPVKLGDGDLAWAVVLDTSTDAGTVTLTFTPSHADCGRLTVSAEPGDAVLFRASLWSATAATTKPSSAGLPVAILVSAVHVEIDPD